jgi:hypothetical protein
MIVYGIILRRVISLSRFEDVRQHCLLFWTYCLSTIVESAALVLSFKAQSRRRDSCDEIHIIMASIRTVLLSSVVVLSLFSKTGPIIAPDFDAAHQGHENDNRACNYGTFQSPDRPPSTIPTTAVGKAESFRLSQYIKVCPQNPKPT